MTLTQPDYRKWADIADTITNPFAPFDDILNALDLDRTSAMMTFTIDFECALTRYTDEYILNIFEMVYHTNRTKYEKLVAIVTAEYDPIKNYDMSESGTDIRTPDLTNEITLNTTLAMTDTRSTTGTSSTQNKLNQMHTTLETPNNFTEKSTHSVNPYDNPGFAEEYTDTNIQSGSRTVTESYSGDADQTTVTGTSTNSGGTSTKNSGTNTQTETGTDTTTHSLRRSGNIGVTTTQQMLESEMILAQKMNIFNIIEQDIASKLFLQVW